MVEAEVEEVEGVWFDEEGFDDCDEVGLVEVVVGQVEVGDSGGGDGFEEGGDQGGTVPDLVLAEVEDGDAGEGF